MRISRIISAVILLITAGFVSAQDLPVFSAELFYPVENRPDFFSAPDFGNGEKDKAEKTDEKKDLFKEAVFIFSGMLYGFEFKYIPGDRRRNVDEVFEISPIGTIPWGDPRLKIRSTRWEEHRNLVHFSYYPDDSMKSWIMYWSSGSFPLIGGKADGGFHRGFEGKEDAIKNGIKEAVRNYLRTRVHNKPQIIEGEFVFAEPPVMSYGGGLYTASVRIKLNTEKISEYSIY